MTCTGTNLLGEGAPCVFQITRRLQLPGVHDCSLTNKDNSLAVICEERGTSFSPLVQGSTQFLADLQDIKLGISTQLSSSRPTFQFSSVRPGAAFNLSIYRLGQTVQLRRSSSRSLNVNKGVFLCAFVDLSFILKCPSQLIDWKKCWVPPQKDLLSNHRKLMALKCGNFLSPNCDTRL